MYSGLANPPSKCHHCASAMSWRAPSVPAVMASTASSTVATPSCTVDAP